MLLISARLPSPGRCGAFTSGRASSVTNIWLRLAARNCASKSENSHSTRITAMTMPRTSSGASGACPATSTSGPKNQINAQSRARPINTHRRREIRNRRIPLIRRISYSLFSILISIRRFCARPALVLLSPTGSLSARPSNLTRSAGRPAATSRSAMVFARASDRP